MDLHKLIIVEGCDGAGKSSLIEVMKAFYEKHGKFRRVRVVHHGSYKGETKIAAKYFAPMARALMEKDTALIMDRSWLSEPIYDHALKRGGSRISTEEHRMLSRVALSLDGRLILCHPPLFSCLENRPEDASWLADVHLQYSRHLTGSRWLHLPMPLWYDYTTDVFEPNMVKRLVVDTVNKGPGAGRFQAGTILMVGDRPNTARHGEIKHRLPFISFGRKDGCSWWLAQQLDSVERSEKDLYWINAYDHTGEVLTDPSFIKELDPRAVILLGTQASKWWKNTKAEQFLAREAPIYEEHHPQAWKRFHYHEPYHLLKTMGDLP